MTLMCTCGYALIKDGGKLQHGYASAANLVCKTPTRKKPVKMSRKKLKRMKIKRPPTGPRTTTSQGM